jgi:chromate transporter
MMRGDGVPTAPRVEVSLGRLARTFLLLGGTSFGGGLTGYLRRTLVDDRRWLTEEEFLRGLSVAQAVPGPNAVNLAIFVGHRFHGLLGSCVAASAVLLVPLVALSALAVAWSTWGLVPGVQGALKTLGAFGAGFMAAMGLSMFRAARLRGADLATGAAAFAAVAILRWPVPAVLATLIPVSVWFHRRDAETEEENL